MTDLRNEQQDKTSPATESDEKAGDKSSGTISSQVSIPIIELEIPAIVDDAFNKPLYNYSGQVVGNSGQAENNIEYEVLDSNKGWREYRKTGGKLRWAIDRWYVGKDKNGKWKKKGQNRKDILPMGDEEYGRWKKARAYARNAKRTKKAEQDTSGIREVDIREPESNRSMGN